MAMAVTRRIASAAVAWDRVRCQRLAQGSFQKLPYGKMRAVGLKVLKNKLSEYVRLAQRGETILVTDRDRVVAELVPPREGRSPEVADAVLAELVRAGWLTPPARHLQGTPGRSPVGPLAEWLRDLDADRGER